MFRLIRISFLFSLSFLGLTGGAQPKLVVGIVVDQMRYDYLDRYWNKFGPGGFRRLVNEGFFCKNANYNYVPTFTGPGHASVYTGATPSVHGIISNQWFSRESGKPVYCAADPDAASVGSEGGAGKMSPRLLLSPTVGEELKKVSSYSKIIGIALKDRGAILPAGHHPHSAYWYDGGGNWITSSYYEKELPHWVSDFNQKELPKKYLSRQWTTLLPLEQYTESDADNNECEQPLNGKGAPVFPYDLPSLMGTNGGLGLIRTTPFGNSLTNDFAQAAIAGENLGRGKATDFLCISFSSTDYIGHQFGPQSVEVEDCYLRLDRDLSDLLKFIDEWVGKKNALVFLTADHGANESVPCLWKKNVPAGVVDEKPVSDSLKKFLWRTYGDSLVKSVSEFDVYLDREAMKRKGLAGDQVANVATGYLQKLEGIAFAVTAADLERRDSSRSAFLPPDSVFVKLTAGFYPSRSGDIVYVLKPHWTLGFHKGTSHGSPYSYDTHVPLLWWGYTVPQGNSNENIAITRIAATVAQLLKIPKPDGCTAAPIQFQK